MTDNSLPGQQTTPNQHSYVDSYTPPSGQNSAAQQPTPSANQSANQPIAQNSQQPSQPPANSQSTQASNPLDELDEILRDNPQRSRQDEELSDMITDKPAAAPQPAATPAPQAPQNSQQQGSDPLAELEKALADYEAAKKKKLGNQDQGSKTPAKRPQGGDPLARLEQALNEYDAKQKELKKETKAVMDSSAKATSTMGDPLAELEALLDEYEAEHQQQRQQTEAELAAAPAVASATPAKSPAPESGGQPEPIEEQNIFELLGVVDAEAAEKEAFLDELQEALWEDFLDKDLELLVEDSQLKEIRNLREQLKSQPDKQDQLILVVEKSVPDIEEIMLEKALQLKEDMVKERLAGMKEYFAQDSAKLEKISTAEKHLSAGRWKSGAQLLNSLLV